MIQQNNLKYKKLMIQQRAQNPKALSPKASNTQPLATHPQHNYTTEQINTYHQMVSAWKVNQRQSISTSKLKNNNVENFMYTANPDFVQDGNLMGNPKNMLESKGNIFSRYTQEVLNYQKAKFVLEEVIQMLEQRKILDLTDNMCIQFMHLLCFRAWVDSNLAINTFRGYHLYDKSAIDSHMPIKQSKVMSNPQQQNLKLLVIPMYKLQQRIQKVFLFYHKSLSFRQGSFKGRLKSFVDFIFKNSKRNNRNKILFGVEGADFTREEQIKYTEDNLIPYVRKQLLSYSGKDMTKMRGVLLGYPGVMRIQMQKLEGFDGFQTIKNTIIKEEQLKISMKPLSLKG